MTIMTARKGPNETVMGLQTSSAMMTIQILLLLIPNEKDLTRGADPRIFLPDTTKNFKNQLALHQVNLPPEMI
jgi:hypothetical protein